MPCNVAFQDQGSEASDLREFSFVQSGDEVTPPDALAQTRRFALVHLCPFWEAEEISISASSKGAAAGIYDLVNCGGQPT